MYIGTYVVVVLQFGPSEIEKSTRGPRNQHFYILAPQPYPLRGARRAVIWVAPGTPVKKRESGRRAQLVAEEGVHSAILEGGPMRQRPWRR
jgi:hypothetical protein